MALESILWRGVNCAQAADWLELKALTELNKTASKGDLRGVSEIGNDWEDDHGLTEEGDETEIVNNPFERWLEDVRNELFFRLHTLKDSYPFRLSMDGAQWKIELKSEYEDPAGSFWYVSCLLMTAVRHDMLSRVHYSKNIDEYFQILSVVAAEHFFGTGEVYWFGWPRPDKTRMPQAIEELLRKMQIIGPSTAHPPPGWSTGSEKDGGVDIVAWRTFGDCFPGRLLMLGQVASGRNWKDKSLYVQLDAFKHWMYPHAQSNILVAHFVPWPQYYDDTCNVDHRPMRANLLESQLGIVIDRFRQVELIPSDGDPALDRHYELLATVAHWAMDIVSRERGRM